jgi:hypothetical protein
MSRLVAATQLAAPPSQQTSLCRSARNGIFRCRDRAPFGDIFEARDAHRDQTDRETPVICATNRRMCHQVRSLRTGWWRTQSDANRSLPAIWRNAGRFFKSAANVTFDAASQRRFFNDLVECSLLKKAGSSVLMQGLGEDTLPETTIKLRESRGLQVHSSDLPMPLAFVRQ